ncbi:DUF4235 domain-containing protein [Amycolatopsis endophytica]|uniref:DUF4235 domain-containing protein n=1 Tax=Amycolatopsis endophytica TaxID=860233 RepID=A0A853B7K5_9PSEU|nr:DUF4235 domain-containing protein [Amycolatopsis endophytica]NYI90486.1 hypothetical protein [Amycolatopsis endophytica]
MKLMYKPLSLAVSALGGVLAGMLFKQAWKASTGEDDAPDATSSDYSTKEVLLAAVLQGAIFGGVKAAVDRAGAKAFTKATGKKLDD